MAGCRGLCSGREEEGQHETVAGPSDWSSLVLSQLLVPLERDCLLQPVVCLRQGNKSPE